MTWFTWRPTTSCWNLGWRLFRTRSIFLGAALSSRRSRSSTRTSSVTWLLLTGPVTWWGPARMCPHTRTWLSCCGCWVYLRMLKVAVIPCSYKRSLPKLSFLWTALRSVCERISVSWRGRDQRAAGRRQRAFLRPALQHRHAGTGGRWPLYPPAHEVTYTVWIPMKSSERLCDPGSWNSEAVSVFPMLTSTLWPHPAACWRTGSHGCTVSSRGPSSTSWPHLTSDQPTTKSWTTSMRTSTGSFWCQVRSRTCLVCLCRTLMKRDILRSQGLAADGLSGFTTVFILRVVIQQSLHKLQVTVINT